MLYLDLTGQDLNIRNMTGRIVPKAPCHVLVNGTVEPMHFGTSKAQHSVGLIYPSSPNVKYVFFRRTFGNALPNNGCMVNGFRLVGVGCNSDNSLPCSLSFVSVSCILLLAVVSHLAALTSLLCLFIFSITRSPDGSEEPYSLGVEGHSAKMPSTVVSF